MSDRSAHAATRPGHPGGRPRSPRPVSYTHLDVYKRQGVPWWMPVRTDAGGW
ncbi:hypothetical protein [Streptomyces fragilis]|uniref:hypothetical protein n=1 Tax=Streptomyces fragilis TaxID=67301 RepID=UPI0024DEABFF|nr:hypothetical protein [Streptomyces fragilis]